jgi:hypothetical protein
VHALHTPNRCRRCAMPDLSQFNTDRTHPGRWTVTFSNNVPEAELAKLRRRINATKWPELLLAYV